MTTKINSIPAICFAMLFTLVAVAQTKTKAKPHSAVASAGTTASIQRGKVVYAKTCVTCHQADGGGLGNMNPPLTKTAYVLGDKARLIKIVLNGLSEEIEINDQTYHNVMPSHAYLKDQEIADVLTYVRNSFGNKAGAVSIADVKKQRSKK